MIKQIPLDGGLITQVDAEEVGISACTELINAEFDKPGLIYKRKGRATAVSTSANVNEIIRWVAPDGTTYWLLCATNGKVYRATSLGSLTELFDSTGTRVRISNYGSLLRFAGGTGFEPKVYQYIDRDFFWWDGSTHGYNTSPAFHIDKAIPQAIDFTLKQCGRLVTDYTTSLAHDTKTYQYKVTFVYDGNQETELPKLSAVNSTMFLDAEAIDNNDVFFFEIEFAEADWNNRCTGINVYRREGSGSYYKVVSASTLSRDRDLSVQVANANAFTKNVMVDSSNGLTSAVNSKELYINGFDNTIATVQNAQFASMVDGSHYGASGDLGNLWGTLTGYTNLHIDTHDGASTNIGNKTGGWWVGDAPKLIYKDGTSITTGNFSTGAVGEWMVYTSAQTVAVDTAQFKYGTRSLKFDITGAGDKYWAYNMGNGFSDSDTIVVSFWIRMDNMSTGSSTSDLACYIGLSSQAGSTGSAITSGDEHIVKYACTNSGSGLGNASDEWSYVQKEILIDDIAGYSASEYILLNIQGNGNTGGTGTIWLDNIAIAKKVYSTTTGKLGAGTDVVASTSFDLGAEDSAVGWCAQFYSQYGIGTIKNNYQYSLKHQNATFSALSNETAHITRSYMWQDNHPTASHRFHYRDLDDSNGIVHPTGETSLDVNFTYSVNLEGRQYVAGVALNPSAENEVHNDWVMFSELSQPDVIPITNYIAIPDLQGGEIKGLAKLIGDLVVFQSKGVYRISIPSAEPTGWSLSESEPNIGCIAPDSIVEHDAGVFFAGTDNMYHLGANFQATPITRTIRDVYQGISNLENTRAIVDVKKNRLLCKFGNTNTTVYALDLGKLAQGVEHWSKMDMSTGNEADLFAIDEDLKVYTVESDTASLVAELNPSSVAESTTFKRTTGWISQSDLGVRSHLRKLNIKYKSAQALTVKFYIDGDSSTVVQTVTIPADTSGADWYRCKPGVRGRSFMIEVSTTSATTDVEIRRMEVEVE